MARPETVQSLWHTNSTALLWLAALAALLAGGLVSPVTGSLLTPLADVTRANERPVETTGHTHVDCCTRTATLLQEIAVMHRSLSQFADSLAVSEARADALARKLLQAERTARRLWRDNTALRSGLEAALSLEEMPEPTVASSQFASSSSSTSQLSPDAGRMAYPATLPVFGAQLSDQTPVGTFLSGVRVPGVCSCGAAWSSAACHRGRRYPDLHARTLPRLRSGP